MTDKQDAFHELDALFAEARRAEPDLPEGLAQRVLSDADAEQSAIASARDTTVRRGGGPRGWARQLSVALGGWAGLGGLATACAAGLWMGFSPPAGWVDPVSLVYESQGTLDVYGDEGVAYFLGLEEG